MYTLSDDRKLPLCLQSGRLHDVENVHAAAVSPARGRHRLTQREITRLNESEACQKDDTVRQRHSRGRGEREGG